MASIKLEQDERGSVVVAMGDIDMTLAAELESALEEASERNERVVVDLAGTTLIDSRAIGVLLSWSGRIRGSGGRLLLAGVDDDVMRLFSTLGLERDFSFRPSRDAALAE